MKLKNAIVKYSKIYIFALSTLTLLSLFIKIEPFSSLIFLALYIVILTPAIIIFFNSKYKKTYIYLIIFVFLTAGIIVLSFRSLRDFFGKTKIDEGVSIGYAQYFGYPIYLDTILFFLIILTPIIFFILNSILYKEYRKYIKNEK